MITGQHEGPLAHALPEETAQLDADLVPHHAVVGPLLEAGRLEQFADQERRARMGLSSPCSTTMPRVMMSGTPSMHAGLLVDREDGHDQAVLGEVAPVAQHLVADARDRRAVDEHAAGGHLVGNPAAVPVEVEHVAVLGDDHLDAVRQVPRQALADARVPGPLAERPVDRDETARPHEREQQLQFLLAPVARHVDVLDALVDRCRRRAGRCGSPRDRSSARCPGSRGPRTRRHRPGASVTWR